MREWTVLVVEDDDGIRLGLRDALRSEGYRVLTAADGEEGLERGLTEDPDLIVLDLMLPRMDGFQVLQRLRDDGVATPVMMLTARGLEEDRVRGLDLGADDYVVKPFGLNELLARIRSRIRSWDRERGFVDRPPLRFGEITVDFTARSARRGADELHLTPLEFELLAFFGERPGRALSRVDLLRAVWAGQDVVSRVVDTAIGVLRRKIEDDASSPRHIVSVRGIGYRFDPQPGGADQALTEG